MLIQAQSFHKSKVGAGWHGKYSGKPFTLKIQNAIKSERKKIDAKKHSAVPQINQSSKPNL